MHIDLITTVCSLCLHAGKYTARSHVNIVNTKESVKVMLLYMHLYLNLDTSNSGSEAVS